MRVGWRPLPRFVPKFSLFPALRRLPRATPAGISFLPSTILGCTRPPSWCLVAVLGRAPLVCSAVWAAGIVETPVAGSFLLVGAGTTVVGVAAGVFVGTVVVLEGAPKK